MNCSNFLRTSIFLIVCVIVMLLTITHSYAESKLSGKVVDENGKPIEGIIISLSPREDRKNKLPPDIDELPFRGFKQSETDETGKFSMTDIVPNVMNALKQFYLLQFIQRLKILAN